jgi:FtsP/CotA-like multicopper oxidase with cupredoxin domain
MIECSKPHARLLIAIAAVTLVSVAPVSGDCPNAQAELTKIGELASVDGTLKAVLMVRNAEKTVPGRNAALQKPMMRYFEGNTDALKVIWPSAPDCLAPGPTLRAKVGERVELTLLNRVDVGAFQGSLDQAETGASDGCDRAVNATVTPVDKKFYPEGRGDTFPNCFHGSSTANLHFHGTHVTPDGFGDNVLVQVRPFPDPSLTDEAFKNEVYDKSVKPIFDEIFTQCGRSDRVPRWQEVAASYREWQEQEVKSYDLTAIWKGKRGPVVDPETGLKTPALPEKNRLSPVNEHAVAAGYWPQYFIGAFPNCFKVSDSEGHEMAQAPGTHWYHAHKHGSTAINLYNGMAGAFIIEGQYDDDLAKAVPNLKATEKVLVVQEFTELPDLELSRAVNPKTAMTNGAQVSGTPQKAPAITMKSGELQLWRIINAKVQPTITGTFAVLPGTTTALPVFRQIAQDGVQFNFVNYAQQPLTAPGIAAAADNIKNGTTFSLAPGQRLDILVQAPLLPAGTASASYQLSGVVNLTVTADATVTAATPFPTSANYPAFPSFLADIPAPRIQRKVTFGWEPYRLNAGPAANNSTHGVQDLTVNPPVKTVALSAVPPATGFPKVAAGNAPYFTIDGEQFSDSKFYQTMVLGDTEEWTIYNTTNAPHPFHIHVNPFQVLEVFDPNDQVVPGTVKSSYKRETNAVWQDVVMIPAALKRPTPTPTSRSLLMVGPDGVATTPGYVRIRSRFVDFPGTFVLHCHILAHEDRGMMQLVRVVDKATAVKHH